MKKVIFAIILTVIIIFASFCSIVNARIINKEDLIEVDGFIDKINAKGSSKLLLTNNKDMVIRKSAYICNRTLAIKANKAASDLSKQLIDKLKNPKKKAKITLVIPK